MFPFFTRFDKLMKYGLMSFSSLSIESAGGDEGGGEGAGAGAALESPGLLDRDSRVEAALEMFEEGGEEGDEAGQGQGKETGAGAEGDEEAQRKAAEEKERLEGQIPEEQLQKDPRYQALDAFQKEHKAVFDKYGLPDAKELDLQLSDSAVLYDIMQGKGTPSQLLETMAQAGHWSKEQQQNVANDLISWLTKTGYLKGGGQDAGQARGKDGKFTDPLEEKVNRLEQERADEKRQAGERAQKERQDNIFNKFKGELDRLGKEKKIDQADIDFFGRETRALVKPAEFKAFTDAIEKDNFVKLRELFAQVYNREVERMKRYTAAQTKTHERQQKSAPRVPAGGAPAAPAGQQKRNLSNRDERLAAADAEWNK